jgi:hypothetical protein
MKKLLALLPLVAILAACGPQRPPTSNEIEHAKQEELSKRGVQTVGMPAIVNFAEKRMMKDIIEKRDQMYPTYTYIVDMNGKFHKVCDSLGYGLPYATQYTNPQSRQVTTTSGGGITSDIMAQADPNGLYSPASADGTWVMCLNPKTKKAEPQYIEPRIVTLTYPLE